MDLTELLAARESVWFDRKREFHANRVELIHDIVCLANAYHDGDRYLLFGQADDGTVSGVTGDPNRLTNANLHDLLRSAPLNRFPTLELAFEQAYGVDIGVIHIGNRPDKPFFMTRDKKEQGKTLRAGVLYTRLGDTNVPMGESAPEDLIELMWRERFGLGLTPLERLRRLLDNPSEWVEIPGKNYRYHREFPEFTIRDGETIHDPFREPWTDRFLDPNASSYYKEVWYLGTLLEQMAFVSCDGGRYEIPMPGYRGNGTLYIKRSSTAFKVSLQLRQYMPLEDVLARAGIDIV